MASDLLEYIESAPARLPSPGAWTDLDWRSAVAQRIASEPLPYRFWSKVNFLGQNGCWEWTAELNKGYGQWSAWKSGRTRQAHRLAYEELRGEIPFELQIDHLCRNKRCVNPAHLEPVTQRINLARGTSAIMAKAKQTHCKRGHEFDEANTYRSANGTRHCRTCHRYSARIARLKAASR